jgi:hypothetical protein
MTVNQRVSGSSPEGGALIIKGLQKCSPFLFYEYVTFTSQIVIYYRFYPHIKFRVSHNIISIKKTHLN